MALQKLDPTKVFKTCSVLDPAIDVEATGEENMKKFSETHDMSLLKMKTGEFATIFHVKNILSSDEAKIKQDHLKITYPEAKPGMTPAQIQKMQPKIEQVNTQEMFIKYFNACVHKYEENGVEHNCNADMFTFTFIQEIGSVALVRSQLGDSLKNV